MKSTMRYGDGALRAKVTSVFVALLLALTAAFGALSTLSVQPAFADDTEPNAIEQDFFVEGNPDATEANATHGESAAEEEVGGIGAILPDMVEFIPMLIAFIILWIILAKFGWPIFSNMLDKRENTIREALQKSEEAQVKAEETLQEYQRQLADAKAQAAQILSDARSAAETIKTDITRQAQQEASDLIAKAKDSIEAEKKQALIDLQTMMADNAVDLATRLVGEGLNEDEQRRIIARYVSEAGSFNGN